MSKEKKQKVDLGAIVITILFFGLIAYSLYTYVIPHSDGYKSFSEAGASLKKQVKKHKDHISVQVNSAESYKMIEGTLAANVWKEMMGVSTESNEGEYLEYFCRTTEYTVYCTRNKDDTYTNALGYDVEYFLTKEQEKEFEKRAKELSEELDLASKSEYEKVRAIYNYICSNVTYDHDHLEDTNYLLQYTAYAALVNKTAVCAGIAQLFYYMAKTAGLDVHINVNDTHAWNFVRVDGLYYYVDATWDLGLSEDQYEYFLRGSYDFHRHEGNLTFNLLEEWDTLKFNDQNEQYTFAEDAY